MTVVVLMDLVLWDNYAEFTAIIVQVHLHYVILPCYYLRHGHYMNTGFYMKIYSSYINQVTISCILSL